MENYSIWTIIFLVFIIIYSWNTNREWRKELNNIEQVESDDVKKIRLLRLLISISGAIFICLTFIFAFLSLAVYKLGVLN